jgi:hypothetical protein
VRAGKKAKAKANTQRTELVKKRTVDDETNAETWMLSKTRREMNACRNNRRHKIAGAEELDADFNILKIHLISDLVKQIR